MPGSALKLPALTLTITVIYLIAWKASAQTGVNSLVYVTVDEKTLYIQGGGGSTGLSSPNELLALDLTLSWNTSHPPWSHVPFVETHPQRLQAPGKTMTFSRTSQTLTIWSFSGSFVYAKNYHLRTGILEELPGLSIPGMNVSEGVMAAIDPLTQHVYIPGAYSGRLMLDHDLMTKTSTSQFTPFTSSTLTGYNFVWNEFRGSFFLWGGQAPSVSSHFFEYKPRSVDSWAELHSNGIAPRPLSGSCMVSAYGGTKMLLFGGYSSDLSTFSKSLFILDVPSMTWSHESGPVTSENRAGMACSVSGDSLIIWGGYRNAAGEEDTIGLTPLVYNFLTRNWTTTFVPGSHHNALQQRDSQGSEASESGTDKPGSNNAAIIGGAAGGGALVLILLVVTLVVCRKRRGQRQQTQVPKEENLSQVQDPEKDLSPHVIDDDEDRFNFKEPVAPSTSQIVKDATSYNVAFDKTSHTSHTKQNQMPSSSARNSRIELEAALHRPSQSPHSIDPLPSPRSTISPSSTIYGVYAAPTLMNPSEPIRSMTSVSKHHIQRMQDHSMTQQQNQVGNGNSPHMNTIITDERGVPLGPQMSQRRPQDHSEGTRSNGERTLTTVEQLEVLHEELFSLNSEIGRLQSSLNQ